MSLANKPRDSKHQFHLFHVDEKWQLLIMRDSFGVSNVVQMCLSDKSMSEKYSRCHLFL